MQTLSRVRFAVRSIFLVALFILPLTALHTVPVAACVPAPTPRPGTPTPTPSPAPTFDEAFAQAAFVFRGHPIRSEDASYKYIDAPATRTTFAVETVWKGSVPAAVTVYTYSCGGDSNPFRQQGSYIIYANMSSTGDLVLVTDRTRLASTNDDEDMAFGLGMPPSAIIIPPTATIAPTAGNNPCTGSQPTPVPSPTIGE